MRAGAGNEIRSDVVDFPPQTVSFPVATVRFDAWQRAASEAVRSAVDRWPHGPGPGVLALLCGVAAALTLIIFGSAAWRLQRPLVAERQVLAARQAAASGHPVSAGPEVPPDFVARLPTDTSSSEAVAALHDAARKAGTTVDSLRVTWAPASATQLGQIELGVDARGSYSALKRWVGETTHRLPAVTLAAVHMQRTAGLTEIEARLTLRCWSRADPAPASVR